MWREKKRCFSQFDTCFAIVWSETWFSNNEAKEAFRKRDSASTMEASDPKHVLLFTLLTDSSMQDCSAGHNLLKITGVYCYSAMF